MNQMSERSDDDGVNRGGYSMCHANGEKRKGVRRGNDAHAFDVDVTY